MKKMLLSPWMIFTPPIIAVIYVAVCCLISVDRSTAGVEATLPQALPLMVGAGPSQHVTTSPSQLSNVGFTVVTDLSSAVALTPSAGTKLTEVQALGGNIRWRSDGTSPTASSGMILYAGDVRWFSRTELATTQFIQESSADLNQNDWSY